MCNMIHSEVWAASLRNMSSAWVMLYAYILLNLRNETHHMCHITLSDVCAASLRHVCKYIYMYIPVYIHTYLQQLKPKTYIHVCTLDTGERYVNTAKICVTWLITCATWIARILERDIYIQQRYVRRESFICATWIYVYTLDNGRMYTYIQHI